MTMSSSTKVDRPDEMEWSAEEEVQLFFALEGLKPVGVNKHFYMACIADRLSKSLNREVQPECIWAHLRTMYNLDMLDEMEPLPFPNEQKDFFLPDTEFSGLMSRKRAESEDRKTENKDKTPIVNKQIVSKDLEKKVAAKLVPVDTPKRTPKRTRGSMSLESNSSPSTTPPPTSNNKRRRI